MKIWNSYAAYMLLYSFYLLCPHLSFTTSFPSIWWESTQCNPSVDLGICCFFLSMVAQLSLVISSSDLNRKNDDLSLSDYGVLLLADRFCGIVQSVEWDSPMMEVFATQVHTLLGRFALGEHWYSVGVQIAGWVYHQFSPKLFIIRFWSPFYSAFSGLCGSNEEKEMVVEKEKHSCLYSSSSQWTLSLSYCVDWLGFRGWKYWPYLFLSYLWIVVYQFILASTVKLCRSGSPWSFLWSIHGTTGLYGFWSPFQLELFSAHAVYAFPSPVFLKVIMTSSQAYNRDGFDYGLLTGLLPNRWMAKTCSCHGHCPRSSLFRNHSLQPLAALCIERGGYFKSWVSFSRAVGIVFFTAFAFKNAPKGKLTWLFGGKVD